MKSSRRTKQLRGFFKILQDWADGCTLEEKIASLALRSMLWGKNPEIEQFAQHIVEQWESEIMKNNELPECPEGLFIYGLASGQALHNTANSR